MTNMKSHWVAAASVLIAASAVAQGVVTAPSTPAVAAPYAGEQARAIKSLSDSEIAGLLAGQGAGFAKAAELNGYPGPAHTLELKDRLALSAEQVAASQNLMTEHKARARVMGADLVQAERRLDALFVAQRASPAAVEQATREVGLLHARLRSEHLITHLTQTALLSPAQIAQYNALRGYSTSAPADAAPGSASPEKKHSHH